MTREIKAECPECGLEVDGASGVGDAKGDQPEPGNLAICIKCAGLGYYEEREDGTLGLRLLTPGEKVELSEDEEVTRIRATIIGMSVWMQP